MSSSWQGQINYEVRLKDMKGGHTVFAVSPLSGTLAAHSSPPSFSHSRGLSYSIGSLFYGYQVMDEQFLPLHFLSQLCFLWNILVTLILSPHNIQRVRCHQSTGKLYRGQHGTTRVITSWHYYILPTLSMNLLR